MPTPEQSTAAVCAKCGEGLRPGMIRCRNCGTVQSKPSNQVQEAAVPQVGTGESPNRNLARSPDQPPAAAKVVQAPRPQAKQPQKSAPPKKPAAAPDKGKPRSVAGKTGDAQKTPKKSAPQPDAPTADESAPADVPDADSASLKPKQVSWLEF